MRAGKVAANFITSKYVVIDQINQVLYHGTFGQE
jgi:hypothetical protein